MALNNNTETDEEEVEDEKWHKIRLKIIQLKEKGLLEGVRTCGVMDKCLFKPNHLQKEPEVMGLHLFCRVGSLLTKLSVLVLLAAIYMHHKEGHLMGSRCAIHNNYLVMEMTRPVTDCTICRQVENVLILNNATRAEFANHAYAGRPVLVRGATDHWSARRTFSFDFFKDLYANTPGAFESVEQECQFFPFRTDFLTLFDVFNMSQSRAMLLDGDEVTWYVGWSNCNPEVAQVLRRHYAKPSFLPDQSESSAIDWIFMGYSGQGASMHLDYVQRPSWQAQISGTKTWKLVPPPECESECQSFSVVVEAGDIILIDTNQWYHDTFIHPGQISITIGSEYD